MKLKFISKLVFGGAMLLATTALFVGCNKYDDDIDELNDRVNQVVSDLNALKTKVDGSLTNISFNSSTGVLTATKNDGSTVTVQTNQTALPEIKLENNILYVGGVNKGAVTVANPVLTVVDGVLTVNGVATSPAIQIGNYYMIKDTNAGTVTISLPDQSGVSQQVVVGLFNPGAAVTSLELIGFGNDPAGTDLLADWANPSLNLTAVNFAAAQAWLGPKGNVVVNQNVAILGEKYALVQVTPASADLTEVEFSFQNSIGGLAPVIVTAATKLDKVVTKANYALWVLKLEAEQKVMAAADYTALWMSAGNPIAYSLVAEGGAQTSLDRPTNIFAVATSFPVVPVFNFDVATSRTTNQTIATNTGITLGIVEASTNETITVDVKGVNAGSIYDAYLKFTPEDIIDFGIQYNPTVDPLQFTITKNPDVSTPASFPVQMSFAYIAGSTFTTVALANAMNVTVKDPLAATVTLSASYTAKAAPANFFTVPMADVYAALTANNKLASWTSKVAVSFAGGVNQNEVTSYKADGITASGTDLVVPTATVVFEEKADGSGTEGDLTKANYLQIYVTNSGVMKAGNYVLEVEFTDNGTGEVLNKALINVAVALPSLSTYYKPISPAYFNAANTALTLYFNKVTTPRVAGPLSADINLAYTDFAALVAQTGAGAGLIFADNEPATSALDNDITYVNNPTWSATLTDVTSYGKDIKAKVTGSPFNVLPAQTLGEFTVKFLSPIKEGTVTPKVGGIAVPSTGTQKINAADIVAKTYNNVDYTILPVWDATAAASVSTSRTDIASVAIKAGSADPAFLTSATIKAATATTAGYIELVPVSLAATATTKITLVITDIWGFVKEVDIPITVTVGL